MVIRILRCGIIGLFFYSFSIAIRLSFYDHRPKAHVALSAYEKLPDAYIGGTPKNLCAHATLL